MKHLAIPAAALLTLGACSGQPAEDELLPGNWKMSAGMTNMDVPGATPEQMNAFKSAVGTMSSQEQCVTAQDAKFDPETMAQAFKQGGDCTVNSFDVSGGTIAGSMSCKMADGTASDIAISGTISPEAFAMSATTLMIQEGLPEGKANVTLEVKGERIGDC
jgi:hypothetical protein